MTSAVVFGYHNVGVRCLSVLLAHGVKVPLVVTHEDDPRENVWFGSVRRLAELNRIPVVMPENPNAPECVEKIAALKPDFLFSFYFRFMLREPLLRIPRRGALNMHGSLLPKFRGRVPVNWAIIKGERETGASLHYMEVKPDAGDLVDQQAVPILPDDTALEVFNKVTFAAEMVLDRALPALIAGKAPRRALDLKTGSYFGRRTPEDGRIDWRQPAQAVHNLVRAVAPPYPGAFSTADGKSLKILRSHYAAEAARNKSAVLYVENGRCYADCGDGRRIEVVVLELDGVPMDAARFAGRYGNRSLSLGD
ncbi:MAG: formyltransferase [Gammaproteobacteria bacterium]|nr:formyltransferase [Gammaproteobacteria bacterium]MDE2461040.1 formyltransferase [Gammaproteobacteria bacterium]